MGINISRIGDATIGTCTCCPGGPLPHTSTGYVLGPCAGSVFAEGLNVARINDQVITDDGHGYIGTIIDGAALTYAEGLNVARIGSYFTGPYFGNIIEGAAKVYGG